jgi:hypothetical protein
MANAFQKLKAEFGESILDPRSAESRKWFMEKVETMTGTVNRDNIMQKQPLREVSRVLPGMMYMFYYSPKGDRRLPYYDSFPLVILLNTFRGGMEGLNLHYLPMDLRQKLFYGLLNTVSDRDVDEKSFMKVTYEILNSARSLKEYRPCFKKYLTEQIRGKIVQVPGNEWEIAVHLPLALWRKADEATVHRESESMIERF